MKEMFIILLRQQKCQLYSNQGEAEMSTAFNKNVYICSLERCKVSCRSSPDLRSLQLLFLMQFCHILGHLWEHKLSTPFIDFLLGFTDGLRILLKILQYMAPFLLSSIEISCPDPSAEKQPQSIMLPSPCFPVVVVFIGCHSSVLSLQTVSRVYTKKVLFWSHLTT